MNKLVFLTFIACQRELPKPVEVDWIIKIGNCDRFNWCRVESELGKKGIMFRPLMGEKICGIYKTHSDEMTDQLQSCSKP